MGCLKVLLLLSAAIAVYVKAETIYGDLYPTSEQLARRDFYLDNTYVASFNEDNKDNIIIDRVEIMYNSDAASCEILSGGISEGKIKIRITPKVGGHHDAAFFILFGRMDSGKSKDVKHADLKFGPG